MTTTVIMTPASEYDVFLTPSLERIETVKTKQVAEELFLIGGVRPEHTGIEVSLKGVTPKTLKLWIAACEEMGRLVSYDHRWFWYEPTYAGSDYPNVSETFEQALAAAKWQLGV